MPLSGRIDTFRGFMDKLGSLILRHDRRLFLTVVYFGHEGLQEVRNIITSASKEAKFRHIKLLTLNETFSRGKALQVSEWSQAQVLVVTEWLRGIAAPVDMLKLVFDACVVSGWGNALVQG